MSDKNSNFKDIHHLTSVKVMKRSALWNLAGIIIPLGLAVIAIPWLLSTFGADRFGLLSILWMGIGYFSLFDFGIGRALTKYASEELASGTLDANRSLIFTAFSALLILGLIAFSIVWISAPLVVELVLKLPAELRGEGVQAFQILAFGIPIVIFTAGLIGLLEALQDFKSIAALRIPLGMLTFLGPVITSLFTTNIAVACSSLLLARVLALIGYVVVVKGKFGIRFREFKVNIDNARNLISFGGWLTVSNIVSPLMNYFDRFFISSALGIAFVSYYVVPYELLLRIQVVILSMFGVLFPALAATQKDNTHIFKSLFDRGINLFNLIVFPLFMIVFYLSNEILLIWLGVDFFDRSLTVTKVLALGMAVNSIGQLFYIALQAKGRTDLIAKTHIIEIVPYVFLLIYSTSNYGIAGAAYAWFARVFVDTLLLGLLARREVPEVAGSIKTAAISMLAVILLAIISLGLEALIFRLFALGFYIFLVFLAFRSKIKKVLT